MKYGILKIGLVAAIIGVSIGLVILFLRMPQVGSTGNFFDALVGSIAFSQYFYWILIFGVLWFVLVIITIVAFVMLKEKPKRGRR